MAEEADEQVPGGKRPEQISTGRDEEDCENHTDCEFSRWGGEGREALGVFRPALSKLLNCKSGFSGELALPIEKAFGVKMDTLMRMQSAYGIAHMRKEKMIQARPVRRKEE